MSRRRDPRAWLSVRTSDRVVRYGLVLLVGQLVWRAIIATGSYFWQDDFRFMADADEGLSADVLLQRYNGHLMPGKYVLAWLVSQGGTSFTLAAVTLVVAQVVAGVLMLWVLAQLFPGRLVAVVGYALYLFTPLGLVASTWWSYGMEGLPMQVALLGTLGSYLAYRRSTRVRWVVVAVASLVLGLVFYEKALLVPAVVLGVALLVLDPGAGLGEWVRGLRRELPFWVPIGVVAGAHLGYFLSVSTSPLTEAPSVDVATFFSDAVGRTLLPGLLGGPWTAAGSLNTLMGSPSRLLVAASAAVWVLFIAFTAHRRRWVAVRAWALAVGYVTLLLLLVLWQRADLANFLARDPRYVLDAVPVIVIAALAALTPVAASRVRHPPVAAAASESAGPTLRSLQTPDGAVTDLEPPWAVVAVVVVIASAWISTGPNLSQLQHGYSRDYVAALAASLAAEPDVVVVDASAPPVDVLIRPVSEVVRAVGLSARFDEPTTDLRIVDGLGQLADVDVPAPDFQQVGPDAGCGWLVRSTDPALRLTSGVPDDGLRVLRIGYLGESSVAVTVAVDGVDVPVVADPGVGHLFVVTRGPVDRIGIDVRDAGRALCITDVALGAPWPASR